MVPLDDAERLRRLISGDEPEELRSTYLARVEAGAVRAAGTSLPVLGLRFETTRSGLLVPQGEGAVGMHHLARRFITAKEIIHEPLTPSAIVNLVTRHSCDTVVAAAATLLATLFEDHPNDQQLQAELAASWTVGATRARALALVNDGWVFLAPQAILAAVKLAFLFPTTGVGDPDHAVGNLIAASLGIAQFLGSSDDHQEPWRGGLPAGLAVEVVQNQHFNDHTPRAVALSRFRRLREIEAEHFGENAARFDSFFEEHTGCSIEALFDVGMTTWMAVNDSRTVRLARDRFDQLDYPPEVVDAALDLLAADEEDLRRLLQQEVERVGFDWAFNQFRRFPMFKAPDGTFVVIHPGFLTERFCGSAAFWEVRSRLPRTPSSGNGEQSRLAGLFEDHHGHLQEVYVGEALRQMVGAMGDGWPRVFDEKDLMERWPGRSVCDFLIDFGTAVVPIEVVNHRLKESVIGGGSVEDLEDDLRIVVEHEGRQIDSVVELLRADPEFGGRTPSPVVYPLVVAAAGFPWGPVTARAAWAGLNEQGILQQAGVRPFQVLDLSDLEKIEAAVVRGEIGLLSLLERRHTAGEEHLPWDTWLDLQHIGLGRPPRLDGPLLAAFRQVAERLGFDPEAIEPPDAA